MPGSAAITASEACILTMLPIQRSMKSWTASISAENSASGITMTISPIIMLECKMKQDGVGCKLQERLTAEQVQRILSGDIGWMMDERRPLLALLYVQMRSCGLRPKTVVVYRRIPFVYGPGNVRVTIDWDIRTGPPREFLNPNGLTLPVEEDVTLLEVKWDEYLPSVIRQAAALTSRSPSAFSKYAACRVYG